MLRNVIDRRKRERLSCTYSARLAKEGLHLPIAGVTENVSEDGAFIKTEGQYAFKLEDHILVTFFLPPDVTGRDTTIGLQGAADIVRVDNENDGVGIQFSKAFERFEKIEIADGKEDIKYKRIAYYITAIAGVSLTEFVTKRPNGFFVERSEHFFDRNVIVQFDTDLVDDEHVLEQIKLSNAHTEALKARVIYIKKRNFVPDVEKVTIGRSPDNDIVLYNKSVSKSHAYLSLPLSRGNSNLIDVGSSNGTFINNNRIISYETYELEDGDEISFGPETKVLYFSAKAFYRFLELPIW